MKVNVMANIWDTTTILFMENAKNSIGLGASETETDFSPMKAATPRVLGFTVSANLSLINTVANNNDKC